MRIIVFTSDYGNWALQGFMHQWNKYSNNMGEVTIAGYTKPKFPILHPFKFISLGNFVDFPAKKWTNAFKMLLENIEDDYIMLFLEDYWLARGINIESIKDIYHTMKDDDTIIRGDLTADVLGDKYHFYKYQGQTDIIIARPDASYNMSTQASIFNRKRLLELIVEDETPWQFELHSCGRLEKTNYKVIGSKQVPVMYQIVIVKGEFDPEKESDVYRKISKSDMEELKSKGFTTKPLE